MRKALRNIRIFGRTSAAVAVGAGRDAMALGLGDISGKWCGNVGSYIFKPRTLTVIFYSDKSRRDYKVDSYQYTDDHHLAARQRGAVHQVRRIQRRSPRHGPDTERRRTAARIPPLLLDRKLVDAPALVQAAALAPHPCASF